MKVPASAMLLFQKPLDTVATVCRTYLAPSPASHHPTNRSHTVCAILRVWQPHIGVRNLLVSCLSKQCSIMTRHSGSGTSLPSLPSHHSTMCIMRIMCLHKLRLNKNITLRATLHIHIQVMANVMQLCDNFTYRIFFRNSKAILE